MTIVVFDVETTSLVHRDRAITDTIQPRMIQIGAILLSKKWEEINIFSAVIRPEGWASTADAAAAHGISERRCDIYGIRAKLALAMLMDFTRSADEIASYNLPFDEMVIDIELDRAGAKPEEWKRGGMKRTCVMALAAQKYNRGTSLKLPVAHERATGIVYEPKHQALPDTRAAIRILRSIRDE